MNHATIETILKPKDGRTFLPDEYLRGHELCFLLHDFLLELLGSAERHGLFSERFEFRDQSDRNSFDHAHDVFEWFEATGRSHERSAFLRRVVFPGLLSDFLHFLYVALEASRTANLTVAYALVRKPLQENLFLFETIASDLGQFASHMVGNPLLLRSQKAGGLQPHRERIQRVLEQIGERDRFDAGYIAQLRYDKQSHDTFDGICHKAIHLFTEHPAIRTENLNINFIFSGWEAKLSQWAYLYSRLPYLLAYTQLLVEFVFGTIERNGGEYVGYMKRRTAAATVLWDATLHNVYRSEPLDRFASLTRAALDDDCQVHGYRNPSDSDLVLMRTDGRWPGQSSASVHLRDIRFDLTSKISQLLRRPR